MDTTPTNADEPLKLVPLPGSDRAPLPNTSTSRATPPDAPVEVTLVLRRRSTPVGGPSGASDAPGATLLGTDPADLQVVVSTMQGLGLSVLLADEASRRVRVRGPADLVARAFGTTLAEVDRKDLGMTVTYRYRTGGLSVPAALDGVIVAVLGLDDRPQARSQYRIAHPSAVTISYTPAQIGGIYRFPQGTDGTGQTVAIIELGGGFGQDELRAYFGELGIPTPTVTAVGVDGANNQPGQDPQGADGEVLLDIEVVGSLAPRAQQVVYFAPNTDAGFLDAVSEAVHATPRPVAISISWGQNEDAWTAQARNAMDGVFADALSLGITVTAAAGDSGSSDRATDSSDHADFPSSSPHVLACGGTRLQADPATGAIAAETVWNDGTQGGATGGGVSDVFDRPTWQTDVGVPGTSGRGVPDVAGNADPQTGYKVLIDGQAGVIGGTSAVAPLWAALVARLTEAVGSPLPPLAPTLYGHATSGRPTPGFHDITSGDNGSFRAGAGWDACTGLGSPDGESLLALLRGGPAGKY
ncbi:MAG: kumamolisin [Pseudonocardiales bacterium]|nr:kumamolisin [Pseudonocardiales bacterium]